MHYEQRWLDLAPALFEDVCVLRDPAANVGHWNLPERRSVGARVIRFSGFDPDRPETVTRYSDRLSLDDLGELAATFEQYAASLKAVGWDEAQRWPYAYDQFDNGVPIPEVAREIYAALGDDSTRFGDPFSTGPGETFFHWLNEPVSGHARVTHLWREIHGRRADLQHAFPDPAGADEDGFIAWTASSGADEHTIPDAFLLR
jgi:hypothetical protein